MVSRRRRGFTLIELLVVIAIIAILAAMLFPVFARARESARKIQCLSNVKNIAMAVQMYLTDYEKLPPKEHRAEVNSWFVDQCGESNGAWFPTKLNPYLRWALVFDEYIKNRDVWRCPSARTWGGARVIIPVVDWFSYVKGNLSALVAFSAPCDVSYPAGWGGEITDSVAQMTKGGAEANSFEQTVGTTEFLNAELKPSQVQDPTWHVVVGDIGWEQAIWGIARLAFPDACHAQCGSDKQRCCGADWANCSWSRDCGIDYHVKHSFWEDPVLSKPWTRHMGGTNIGFMDGHAAWMSAMAIIANSQGGQGFSGDTTHGKLRIGPDSASTPAWGCECKWGK
jgi:prepilin-type N-terminal cleavage/methylation domain-containing protein/prepilin-type processing-associated H-X9-DG protein